MAREIEQVKLFKIETPQAAAKLRALIAAGGDAIEGPFDGEEAITLMADLDAGATGTMTSATLPDLIGPAVTAYLAGRRARRRRSTSGCCRSSTSRTGNAAGGRARW